MRRARYAARWPDDPADPGVVIFRRSTFRDLRELGMTRRRAFFYPIKGTRAYGAWCVLRGRSVAYRLHLVGGPIIFDNPIGGWLTDCRIDGPPGRPDDRARFPMRDLLFVASIAVDLRDLEARVGDMRDSLVAEVRRLRALEDRPTLSEIAEATGYSLQRIAQMAKGADRADV